MHPEPFVWRSESDAPPPDSLTPIDDSARADDALRAVRRGEFLLYRGDFLNARQLLSAMARRLPAPKPASSPLDAFRSERAARALEHETLSRLLVELDGSLRLGLKRAPDTRLACEQAWGPSEGPRTLVPLKTLLGVLGAAEWRKKGLHVPGLKKTLTPHYGVYVPTRTDYVELLGQLKGVRGTRCFDVGTGTGVLGLLLLERGAAHVTGTDLEERAVRCARENASHFGVADRFLVEQRALFPDGLADLVVCNPPWIPEPPKNRVDRAVFDPDSAMLRAFLDGLVEHLAPGGRGVLLVSNLAELLGLRPPDFLHDAFERAGLTCLDHLERRPSHGKARDRADPLHAVRSKEVTSMWVLGRKPTEVSSRPPRSTGLREPPQRTRPSARSTNGS